MPLTDIEIAKKTTKQPINKIAQKLAISEFDIIPYGYDKAKITKNAFQKIKTNPDGALILVTAITPTPAGEGKTTTAIGLHDALRLLGKNSIACLRQPSLGPVFGMKGGATGGGYAQVVPMEEINLHFTGDFHAITSAHNLLSAMLDNHLQQGNLLNIDVRNIIWPRVLDVNDRSLRNIVIGLGGKINGIPRESNFDITAASELMAILCLANDTTDLTARIDAIIVAYDTTGKPITAKQLKASGAMSVLLKDALQPNLVQTLEHNPVLIHGGPFANIAHGCSSVIATKYGLKLADYVITEAGFGADLGAEKFFDIKCREANLTPNAVVVVATIRALKMHGGVPLAEINYPNVAAVLKGSSNLIKHVNNIKKFNLPVVIAINSFTTDTAEEINMIKNIAEDLAVEFSLCTHWADGGKGAADLAHKVLGLLEKPADFKLLYENNIALIDKIKSIAINIYGAKDIELSKIAQEKLNQLEKTGFGGLPICVAKTQYSFSVDPKLYGAPDNHILIIHDIRLSAGAGFVVVISANIMTMPGLPKKPAAESIHLNEKSEIEGLF